MSYLRHKLLTSQITKALLCERRDFYYLLKLVADRDIPKIEVKLVRSRAFEECMYADASLKSMSTKYD